MAVTDATPDALVAAVVEDKAAAAPVAGETNVTVTPGTGLLPRSRTTTCSAAAKAPFTCTVCGVPPVMAIELAAPGLFVKANVAGVATPATAAAIL